MDVINEAAAALKEINDQGIEVSNGWYEKELPFPYIKLWYLGGNDEEPSDDECESESGIVQVTVFAREDRADLINKAKSLMKEYGFDYLGRDSDSANVEEKVYMHAARFELNK